MAESILFNVVANILTKLGSPAVKEIGLLWGVNEELEKLDDTLSAIQAVLLDAEEQQSKSHSVKDWVSKLKDVVYEIEDLMDECAYDALKAHVLAKDQRKRKQVRRLFSKLKRPYSNLKLAHQIKDIRERLKAVNDNKTQFSFSETVLHTSLSDDQFKKKRETYSFILEEEVIGRSDEKDEIIKLLLNTNIKEDIAIISIVGMGGLGKTTLAQFVYNDQKITKHFELKLWVCVSEDFDVKTIAEKIIESATNQSKSFKSLDSLANELRKQIDGKKYLLVMDDVWNKDDKKWNDLKQLLMSGTQGSRILITTRDEYVAKIHGTTFAHSLEKLDDLNSWLLFEKMAFSEGQWEEFENSNLIEIGREIVAKLRGVPLVIRTIGRLLKEKKSQPFWLSFKDKELYQLIEQEKNENLDYILSILELSYKHLLANLKQCFLYCALFPKDHVIKKDELIILWRAQGFIPPNEKDKLIDIGEDYFFELLSKSFFQDVTKDGSGNIKTCKMHDLMHDLACSIVKNECIHGLNNNIDKRTHHLSLSLSSMSPEEFKELQKKLSKARNLRTFFLLDPNYMRNWVQDFNKFFPDNSRLRTLKVYFDRRENSFRSILGRFKHLRYLLIWGLKLKYLPNCFTKLYNLETLSIQHWSKLENFPCDIKNLINLKHLNLSSNKNLKFLPNSITELYKLEALSLSNCKNLKELPRDIKKLVNLKHLNLSSNVNLKFLPNSITELYKLEALNLSNCENLKEFPRDIKKLVNLKHLSTYGCDSLNHFPKGLGELTNLQTLDEFVLGGNNGAGLNELNGLNKLTGCLRIRNLQICNDVDLQLKAKFLQLKSGLQDLRLEWMDLSTEPTDDIYERVLDCLQPQSNIQELYIEGYGGVKLCNWLTFGTLGHLVKISLVECKRLEHLPQFDQFPYLESISLKDLPSMEYIVDDDSVSSSTIFPSLRYLEIIHIPKLKRWWKGTNSTESIELSGDLFSIIFPVLSSLEIFGCTLHVLMSFRTPSLELLSIEDFKEHPIEEDGFDVVPWQNCENLSSLSLACFSKLEYLPNCLQHVTTLQHLSLCSCDNLKSLPEWIDNLTSLTKLEISHCENLTSMPEGIRHIHGLQLLYIVECPILEKMCKKDTGDDWPKIAHIPIVYLSHKRQ